jgi:hypothetical protein
MIPGITFLDSFTSYPLYCFVTVLGFVPDIIHTKNGYQPFDKARSVIAMSDWYPVKKGSPIVSLASNLLSNPPTVPGFTVVLSAGIRFGTIGTSEQLNHVKCPGAAKIVAME